MATLYEYHNTGENTASWLYGDVWHGQSFTPSITHTITSVKLKLYKVDSPGTVTVSIRAADVDGLPIGDDLCSGSIDGNTLLTAPGEWREIMLGTGCILDANTKYAIVLRAISQTLAWWLDESNSYAGGRGCDSEDAGISWDPESYLTFDFMFEEWGTASSIPIPPYNLTALEALRNIEMSAGGRIYVDGEGNLRYANRWARNP